MQRRVAELVAGEPGVAEHVPPLRRPAAAAVRGARRAAAELHDLRYERRAANAQARDRSPRDQHAQLHARSDRRAISAAKNKLITADKYEPRSGQPAEPRRRRGLSGLPRAAARLVGRRFRRPAAARRAAAVRQRRDSRRTRRALSLRAGRRVPGHEPGAVCDPAGAVDRLSEPGGDGRSRSVDLRLARGGPQQHSGVRARLSAGEGRAARAELSQHEADPARRRRADRPQPAAQEEGAVDRERRGRAGAADVVRRPGRRGGRHRRPDSHGRRRAGRGSRATSRFSTA